MGEFKHKHSLGQNFLKDKGVLARIIDSVDVQEDDLIIEVGPGQGALTKFLKLLKANLRCFEVINHFIFSSNWLYKFRMFLNIFL